MSKTQSYRTPMGRVRNLGAAGSGTDHFLAQRMSAIGLAILLPTFAISVIVGTDGSYDALTGWLGHPFNAVVTALLALTALFHMRVGLQTVIEDYIHKPSTKFILLILNSFIPVGLGAVALLSILKVFTGA